MSTDLPDAAEAVVTPPADADANLVAKVAAAMAEVSSVEKDGQNTEHHYTYASIEAMLKAVRRPLLTRGVILTAVPSSFTQSERRSKNGALGIVVVVEVDFTFTDGEEELKIAGWRGEGIDYADKAFGKAYTNALKTFIRAQWLLPAGTDEDSDRESPDRGTYADQAPAPPAWQQEADEARVRELADALTPLIGRARVRTVYRTIKDSLDYFPSGFVGFAKLLAAELDAEAGPELAQARAHREVRERDEAAAKAADEAAEGPDEPTPEEDLTPAERARAAAAAKDAELDEPTPEEEAPEPEGPPPGTVDPPSLGGTADAEEATERMREAGCICKDPLTTADKDRDGACPIKGHGIPF